jgi:hypothetical protein
MKQTGMTKMRGGRRAWQAAGLGLLSCVAAACEPGAAPSREAAPTTLGSTAQALILPDGGIVADAGPGNDAGATDAGPGNDAGAADAGPGNDGGVDAAPPGPSNDCCSISSSPGCTDPDVLACVCEWDALCCSSTYDSFCASIAVSRCEQPCEERPPVSDCCNERDVPGCTDPVVEDCVCQVDPFCCIFLYDQNCVDIGIASCSSACGSP